MNKQNEKICNKEECYDLLDDIKHNAELLKKTEVEIDRKTKYRSIFAQCLVTGAAMLSTAGCGMPIGYSAILLPQLKNSNDSLQIDENMGSWIASIHSAATPGGSLLSGILMDMFGRKATVQMSSIPLILGWIIISFAPNHTLILAGRLIAGISVGLVGAPAQVLVSEISEPNLRGIFSSVPLASYAFGILIVYMLGAWLNWRLVAALSAVLPIIAAIVLFFLPETPIWLLKKGKMDEARLALCWLRGDNVINVKKEFQALVDRADAEEKREKISPFKIIFQPEVIKPFVIINIFNILQVLSGTYLVVFYAVDIIDHISNGDVDNFLAAVLTACIRFVFTIVASVLLGLIGRRSLGLISGIGTAFAAISLSIHLRYETTEYSAYISAFLILLYVALNTIGFMTLPAILIGELYPVKFRGFGGGLTFTLFNTLLFLVAKIFPVIKSAIGINGIFLIFGISSIICSIFLHATLPETKGKTLTDIEDYFKQSNWFWYSRKADYDRSHNSSNNNVSHA